MILDVFEAFDVTGRQVNLVAKAELQPQAEEDHRYPDLPQVGNRQMRLEPTGEQGILCNHDDRITLIVHIIELFGRGAPRQCNELVHVERPREPGRHKLVTNIMRPCAKERVPLIRSRRHNISHATAIQQGVARKHCKPWLCGRHEASPRRETSMGLSPETPGACATINPSVE